MAKRVDGLPVVVVQFAKVKIFRGVLHASEYNLLMLFFICVL